MKKRKMREMKKRVSKKISLSGTFTVLVTAIAACVVGAVIFFEKIVRFNSFALNYVRSLPVYLTLASLALATLAIIALKSSRSNRGKGTYLRGGIASGHTALAFALSTSIAFASKDPMTTTFGIILALLVAESRVESGIHTLLEVILGGVIGILTTIIVFQLSAIWLP